MSVFKDNKIKWILKSNKFIFVLKVFLLRIGEMKLKKQFFEFEF